MTCQIAIHFVNLPTESERILFCYNKFSGRHIHQTCLYSCKLIMVVAVNWHLADVSNSKYQRDPP